MEVIREIHDLLLTAKSFMIISDEMIKNLGEETYIYDEDELIISSKLASEIYKSSLKQISEFRNFIDIIDIHLDMCLVINGELHTAWNTKSEKIDSLDLKKELRINSLVLRLHRKSSIGWEFRKKLANACDLNVYNEISFLDELASTQKQNYYLWEYRRWLFNSILSDDERKLEILNLKKFCENHPSDSSSYHYLSYIMNYLSLKSDAYEWITTLCDKFYGINGLYDDLAPPGYETLHLFRSKSRNLSNLPQEISYAEIQIQLNRQNIMKYLYLLI